MSAPIVLTLKKLGTIIVEGKTNANLFNQLGMASTGHDKPERKSARGERNTMKIIEFSRLLKNVESAIPKNVTASKNGIIKAITAKKLPLEGRLNHL